MPRIPDELIDRIKQTTDIVAVIKARGVKLRKTGQQYKGRCPFHEEKTPSLRSRRRNTCGIVLAVTRAVT